MVGNEYIGVDAEYLKELEEKAKKFDFFEGYIKGVEAAFAFAEEIAKFAKTERTITIPKAHGRKQALQMIDEIEALADRKTENNSEIPNNCDTCKWGEWYRNGRDITNMDDECGGCCSWNSKWTPKDEPQTVRSNLEPFRVDEPQTERSE